MSNELLAFQEDFFQEVYRGPLFQAISLRMPSSMYSQTI